jgi:ABC-2 type transport system permease protein
MLHNTWLIAKREYVERIRAKSFIVMTVLIPALMGGLTFAMSYATGKNKSEVNIAIVTQDSRFGLDMRPTQIPESRWLPLGHATRAWPLQPNL